MKTLIYFVLAIAFILILTSFVMGQPELPPMLPDNPDQTPIDGGLSILAALGGGYAIKKLNDRKDAN